LGCKLNEIKLWDKASEEYFQVVNGYKWYAKSRETLQNDPIIKRLILYGKGSTLEVGCGSGKNSLALAIHGTRPLVLDFSSTAVNFAKYLFNNAATDGDFVVADMRYLPFRDCSFNLVFSDHTLDHIREYEEALEEMIRVVMIDGYLLITVPNRIRIDGWNLYNLIHKPRFTNISFTPLALLKLIKKHKLQPLELFGYQFLSPLLVPLFYWYVFRPLMNRLKLRGGDTSQKYSLAKITQDYFTFRERQGIIKRILDFDRKDHWPFIAINIGVLAHKIRCFAKNETCKQTSFKHLLISRT
jgi:ubiquinone/menaquinone biosynthesis C-methylase UbiE